MKRHPAIQPADPKTFSSLTQFSCVIDVRSPSEFADDHLPGAINLPVLDDEQRASVGTIYKQQSPFAAKKIGAALVSENIARHLRESLLDQAREWRPLVYCWRGGQRSGAMTTVLRQIGWDAMQLEGGYKAYRRHVVESLNTLPANFNYRIIKGATGSAKTRVLHAISQLGGQIIDLEGLAGHKGSVLGLVPDTRQPTQKTFESQLLKALLKLAPERPVFIEAESRKIGALHLPERLIESMRASPCIAIEATRQARVSFLLGDYAYFTEQVDQLCKRLDALKSIRGEEAINRWRNLAKAADWHTFVDALLGEHYDPLYTRSQDTNYRISGQHEQTIFADALDAPAIERLAEEAIRLANA